MRRTKRVLRYVGNRETPEAELYDVVEQYIEVSQLRIQADLTLGADLQAFAKTCPDPLFSNMTKSSHGLYVPTLESAETLFWLTSPPNTVFTERPKGLVVEPMEVNLTEALVGYRAWDVHADGTLASVRDYSAKWPALEPMRAVCERCAESPTSGCGCGIYAVDLPDDVPEADLFGQVYGWGRYVRGDHGWRAQFAYPKKFLVRMGREAMIPLLKKYAVPISIAVAMPVYDPQEDGYENRQDPANWSRGTGAEPDPAEDTEAGYPEDD